MDAINLCIAPVSGRTCACEENTHRLLSVREMVSASLDMLCCSLSLALAAGAMA